MLTPSRVSPSASTAGKRTMAVARRCIRPSCAQPPRRHASASRTSVDWTAKTVNGTGTELETESAGTDTRWPESDNDGSSPHRPHRPDKFRFAGPQTHGRPRDLPRIVLRNPHHANKDPTFAAAGLEPFSKEGNSHSPHLSAFRELKTSQARTFGPFSLEEDAIILNALADSDLLNSLPNRHGKPLIAIHFKTNQLLFRPLSSIHKRIASLVKLFPDKLKFYIDLVSNSPPPPPTSRKRAKAKIALALEVASFSSSSKSSSPAYLSYPGSFWTPSLAKKLAEAVEVFGFKWSLISKEPAFVGFTPRFLNDVYWKDKAQLLSDGKVPESHSLRKTSRYKWTPELEELLVSSAPKFIADSTAPYARMAQMKEFSHLTPKQINVHWNEHMDPYMQALKDTGIPGTKNVGIKYWTEEEKQLLLEASQNYRDKVVLPKLQNEGNVELSVKDTRIPFFKLRRTLPELSKYSSEHIRLQHKALTVVSPKDANWTKEEDAAILDFKARYPTSTPWRLFYHQDALARALKQKNAATEGQNAKGARRRYCADTSHSRNRKLQKVP
ncbi:hypothetical protein BC830DRAFT_836390 [Chytriomyces sp. MP71]|nr:hypothetical protein BC830DRAFT_836390 [Chytriomyces sp. MP71]